MRIDQPDQGDNLFLSFKDRDPDAFKQVFDHYHKGQFYFAYSIVQDWDEAEDIVQDAFRVLWDRWTSINDQDHLKRYLFEVTKNAALKHLKKKSKWQSIAKALPVSPVDERNKLDAAAHKAWILSIIHQEVEKLSAERKAVFKLIFYEGMKTGEVAAKLGKTEQNVLNLKTEAINKLRNVLPPSALLMIYLMLSITNQ
jgi:RNA polymerase sigma factor (sigma-70 family)